MKKYALLLVIITVIFPSCMVSMNPNLAFQAIGRAQTTADTADQKATCALQKADENKVQIAQLMARIAALEESQNKK